MKRTIGKILKIFTTVLIIAAVVLAMALAGVRLFNIQIFTVLSGSMEPDLPTGSLVYVKEVDTDELKAGDVITYEVVGETTATHRIIELVPDENDPSVIRFRTQGDANEHADGGLVDKSQVIGSPIFHIPELGYFANYIQSRNGVFMIVGVCAGIVILILVSDMLDEEKKDGDGKSKKKKVEGKHAAGASADEEGKE